MTTINAKPKSRKGFASMSPEKVREICSKGGKAAQAKGTAHRWSSEEARAAGRKGGLATTLRRDLEHTWDERQVTGEGRG